MKRKFGSTDYIITIVPLVVILLMSLFIIIAPDKSNTVIEGLRLFLINEVGFYYILIGVLSVILCIWLASSKYGDIRLGNIDKPKYGNFAWGSMIFTSTMAADILYYSFHEWVYYYQSLSLDVGSLSLAEQQKWASTYPLFHWGITPWSFYILPAVAYAFMYFVKGNKVQRLSEACRPVLGKRIDGITGKVIDIVSVVALLLATSTTFSVATPLLSNIVSDLFNIPHTNLLTISMLLIIALIYTIAVISGLKGISNLAKICTTLFSLTVATVFIFGDTRFIIESSISGLGNYIQNFVSMSTWLDPTRLSSGETVISRTTTGFPQDWTVFYWAYWIAWSVATPFFIAMISEGRTIRNMITGGFLAGLSGTFMSFFVFGNVGLAQQVSGRIDLVSRFSESSSQSEVIVEILKGIPIPPVITLSLVAITMILLYSSTFDALVYVISKYSYARSHEKEPGKAMKVYWAILMIALPSVLIFTDKTTQQLQSLSIVAAFAISLLLVMIVVGFIKSITSQED